MEKVNYPRESKTIVPQIVSRVLNYADRLCSTMSDFCSPFQINNRQYLKAQHPFGHDRWFLQQFFDMPLGDTGNSFEVASTKGIDFHLLRSQEFRQNRSWIFETLIQELFCVEAAPLTFNIQDSFSKRHNPNYQQMEMSLSKSLDSSVLKPVFLFKTAAKSEEKTVVTLAADRKSKHPANGEKLVSIYMDLTKLPVPLPMVPDKCAMMNQELVNRKCRKINKTSKKKRRRQKRSNCADHRTEMDMITDERKTHCGNVDIVINVADGQLPGSSVSFILGHIENDSQDDWDCDDEWDSNNCSISMTDVTFEFPDLLTNSLSSLCLGATATILNNTTACQVNVIDIRESSTKLSDVNRKWQMMMADINSSPKKPTKVSFPEDNLTTEYPVEMYDRKSEWEIFARERAYFKRRVEKTEEILSPILCASHREKVYQRLSNDLQLPS